MKSLYHRANYLISALKPGDAPPDQGYEVAFAGRSNAGKSSAINAICQQRIARTSKTPGRTQMLNFFALDAERRLVDLPGYGYAKVPAGMQNHWRVAMETYLQTRTSLKGIVLLMDIRHPLTDFDWQLIDWCQIRPHPLHIVITKADKLSRGAAQNTMMKVRAALQGGDSSAPISLQLFSSLKRQGVEQAIEVLDKWLAVSRFTPTEQPVQN